MEKLQAVSRKKLEKEKQNFDDLHQNKNNNKSKINDDAKTQKNRLKPKKSFKKSKKINKNSKIIAIFKKFLKNTSLVISQNKFSFAIVFLLFALALVFSILTFSNSSYFEFLNRPKVLQSSNVILLILCPFLFLSFLLFFVSSFFETLKQQNTDPKKPLRKPNKKNFKFISIFLLVLFFILFFNTKLLALCVLTSFFLCFDVFLCFLSQKQKSSRFVSIVMLLFSICNWLSFYLIYLLN